MNSIKTKVYYNPITEEVWLAEFDSIFKKYNMEMYFLQRDQYDGDLMSKDMLDQFLEKFVYIGDL